MNYYTSLLKRLKRIFPIPLLLKMYKSYIQPKLDYGLTVWGCTTEGNMYKIQRIQNHTARIIYGNFDYIHTRGIDLVKSLGLYTMRERRDYFIACLMFKAIHGLTPSYLSNHITMNVDIHGYDTRSSENMNVYRPTIHKEMFRNSFMCKGSDIWNALPNEVKESPNMDSFKRNYNFFKGSQGFGTEYM